MARNKYLIEIVRVGDNQHEHVEKRSDTLSFDVEAKKKDGSDIVIKVEPKDLYEVPINAFSKLIKWLKTGQTNHYLLVVGPDGTPIKETAPAISGKVLKVARDWRGLGKAISDSFGSNFQIPLIAIILALVGAVLLFGFLVWRGTIPLPRSWTQ